MTELLNRIVELSVPIFIISSMIGVGLSLTVKQIIAPLENKRLVAVSLFANFILVPIFVYIMMKIVPLPADQQTALLILSLSAGAPFLPKLATISKGNEAFSIGLMLLLMVVSILYIPLVLPLFLKGVTVDPLEIALSLVVIILLPLVLALLVRASAEKLAVKCTAFFVAVSNLALVLLLAGLIILHWRNVIAMLGMPLVAMLLFLIGALLIGFLLGGSSNAIRKVLSLGTGQRNIGAAMLVVAKNQSLGDRHAILTMMVAFSVIGLLVMMPVAKWMARHFESTNLDIS